MIGKISLFDPQRCLEDSARFDPILTSLDFATTVISQDKVVGLVSNPQPAGLGRID
jgi:hypothetical protein